MIFFHQIFGMVCVNKDMSGESYFPFYFDQGKVER